MHDVSDEFARCWQAAGRHIQIQAQGPLHSWLSATNFNTRPSSENVWSVSVPPNAPVRTEVSGFPAFGEIRRALQEVASLS